MPVISTFISTLASGFTLIAAMYLIFYAGANVKPVPLAIFLGIIFTQLLSILDRTDTLCSAEVALKKARISNR